MHPSGPLAPTDHQCTFPTPTDHKCTPLSPTEPLQPKLTSTVSLQPLLITMVLLSPHWCPPRCPLCPPNSLAPTDHHGVPWTPTDLQCTPPARTATHVFFSIGHSGILPPDSLQQEVCYWKCHQVKIKLKPFHETLWWQNLLEGRLRNIRKNLPLHQRGVRDCD